MELGTKLHDELEKYLKGGVVPPTLLARKALEFLPEPDPALLVEVEMELETYPGGPIWKGKIDLADPRNARSPMVYDHKTTGNARWAKTPAELQKSAQMVSYALWMGAVACPDAEEVRLQHTYMVTEGKPVSFHVPAIVVPEQVQPVWEREIENTRQMALLAKYRPDPMDVRPNTDTCDAFGGCPHRSKCFGAEAGRGLRKSITGVLKGDRPMAESALARLKAAKNGTAAPPPAPPAAAAAAPAKPAPAKTAAAAPAKPAPAPPPAGGGLARLKAASAANGTKAAAPAPAAKTPIVAPDARPPDPSTTEEEEETAAAPEGGEETVAEEPQEEAAPPPPAPAAAPATVKPKTATRTKTPEPGGGVIISRELVLLVNGWVTKGGLAVPVEEWMAPAAKAAGEAAKAAGDSKLADWRGIEYGRAPAYLSEALDKHIAKHPPSGFIALDSSAPGFAVLMEKLVPLAAFVIRH
jgi:hypothetical protein